MVTGRIKETGKGIRLRTPFQKFLSGLEAAQLDVNETLTELRAFAEVMARKTNAIDFDEDGNFYVTAAGPIEKVIEVLSVQLEKLKRIEKDRSRY